MNEAYILIIPFPCLGGCDGRTDQLLSSAIALRLLPPRESGHCIRLAHPDKGGG
ncbi:MAG: hypothetical protein LLG04_17375 [Parachlamydia sp.]|nr:hypothetical protein [Parachlamydia sp.]